MRHADLRALPWIAAVSAPTPEVPHVPPFPRPAFARPRHARARSVLGHNRADGYVTAPDRADGPEREYLPERFRRQHRERLLTESASRDSTEDGPPRSQSRELSHLGE